MQRSKMDNMSRSVKLNDISRLTGTRYLPLLLHCGIHDRALECQRLLLASGADPSEATEDELGPFELALYHPVCFPRISLLTISKGKNRPF